MNALPFVTMAGVTPPVGHFLASNYNPMGRKVVHRSTFFTLPSFSGNDTHSVALMDGQCVQAAAILSIRTGGRGPWVSYFTVGIGCRRLGLGKTLINGIKERFEGIYLECYGGNEAGMAFYSAMGLERVEESDGYVMLKWEA